MNIYPTEEQKQKHVRDWIRCVLLSADGWTPGMIAQSQLIHETTVRRHLNDWLNSEKLAPANGGSDSHLSKEKKPLNSLHI